MSKKKIARKPRAPKKARAKTAAKKPLPPPQPYAVSANRDTITRIIKLAINGEGDLAGPDSVEFALAQQMRRLLDDAIERATPKPAAESQVDRARCCIEDAKDHLDDVPEKFLELVAATQRGVNPGEELADLAGVLSAVRLEVGEALKALSGGEAQS